ncbi:Hpt domain-containing protein, partial [bacterium]|nr:Hpt domain-containing protein [bacterium]
MDNQQDDQLTEELTQFFISELARKIEKFDKDLSDHNKEEVTRFGHSLKGTAGSYGFPQFSQMGSEIEEAGKIEQWEKIENLKKQIVHEFKLLGERYEA